MHTDNVFIFRRGQLWQEPAFFALDSWRGLAAIAVVVYHFTTYGIDIMPGGYLAVDFFFALSGFVIAKAYSKRLKDGGELTWFLKTRLIRLYPLFAVGVLFGAVKELTRIYAHHPLNMSTPSLLIALLANAVMMPAPVPSAQNLLFPIDPVGWSLFFEIVVNLLFVLCLVRFSTKTLIFVAATSAIALILLGMHYESIVMGWSWPTFPGGFARAMFSFTVGLLIARTIARKPTSSWLVLLFPIILLAVMVCRIPSAARLPYDLCAILFIMPASLAHCRCYL